MRTQSHAQRSFVWDAQRQKSEECQRTRIKHNTNHASHNGRHARKVQDKRNCTRLVPGGPQRRRPAGCAGIREEACSCQEAVSNSLEACIAGGFKHIRNLPLHEKRVSPGGPPRRKPARSTGFRGEACSCQSADTKSLEACIAGGLNHIRNLPTHEKRLSPGGPQCGRPARGTCIRGEACSYQSAVKKVWKPA